MPTELSQFQPDSQVAHRTSHNLAQRGKWTGSPRGPAMEAERVHSYTICRTPYVVYMRTGSESGRVQHMHTNTTPAFSLEKSKERKRKEKNVHAPQPRDPYLQSPDCGNLISVLHWRHLGN